MSSETFNPSSERETEINHNPLKPESKNRAQVLTLLASLTALAPSVAQAQELEGPIAPQEAKAEPQPSSQNTENQPLTLPQEIGLGAFAVNPNATLILNTTNRWSKPTDSTTSGNQFDGGPSLVEGRLTGQTHPGVIPDGNLGFLIAGGAADASPYFLGEARARWGRLGFTGGASTNPSSVLANFQHLRDETGAKIKLDASYYDLTQLPTGLDRFAKLRFFAGPQRNRDMLEIFGGIRSGVGITGTPKPTGMAGFNLNLDGTSLGFTGHLDEQRNFHGELHDRVVKYSKNNRLRYEGIFVGLANNYSTDRNHERELSVGGSVLNAIGFGENIAGDTKRFNLYNRTDIAKTGVGDGKKGVPDWNSSFGASITPFKNAPDVVLTPEFSVMETTVGKTRQAVSRLMLNFQIKI